MIVAAIRHSVADYDAWKAEYDAMTPVSRGAKFARVNRAVDDGNTVAVVCGFETVDEANAFLGDPNLKEAMGRAGVQGEPRIEIYEEVEALMA